MVFFWARWRVFQRLLIAFMLIWFSLVAYRILVMGVLGSLLNFPVDSGSYVQNSTETMENIVAGASSENARIIPGTTSTTERLKLQTENFETSNFEEKFSERESAVSAWKRLPPGHWKMLFDLYGVSVWDRFVTVLPPIFLAVTIPPQDVIRLRHARDLETSKSFQTGTWSSMGLDSTDVSGELRRLLEIIFRPTV